RQRSGKVATSARLVNERRAPAPPFLGHLYHAVHARMDDTGVAVAPRLGERQAEAHEVGREAFVGDTRRAEAGPVVFAAVDDLHIRWAVGGTRVGTGEAGAPGRGERCLVDVDGAVSGLGQPIVVLQL